MEIFVFATEFCGSNMSQKIKSDRICATCCGDKIFCRDKDFQKTSPIHTKGFAAAMCRHNMLLQLVAKPVHTD